MGMFHVSFISYFTCIIPMFRIAAMKAFISTLVTANGCMASELKLIPLDAAQDYQVACFFFFIFTEGHCCFL